MPLYEYKGQVYDLSETDPAAAKAKIMSHLDKAYEQKRSSVLDFLPKGVPEWMQSKPGQGWDDANATAAGGDPTNPMSYLSDAQKTEQGSTMQSISQGVNRGVQVGAGVAKGAVINPVAAVAQVVGGQGGREFAQAAQESYDTQRKNAGAEGFDWAELAGSVISPVNRIIPGGKATDALLSNSATGRLLSRGILGGATGAVLNPVLGEDLSAEDVLKGKAEQAGWGALAGRLGNNIGELLTPKLKEGAADLIKKGIPVSPGQAYEGLPGVLFRQIEKLDIPFMRVNKDAINLGYTKAVGDDVLSSIGKTLPQNVKNGQQAFAYINRELNDAYDTGLAKIGKVAVDDEFTTAINSVKTVVNDSLDSKQASSFNKFVRDNIDARLKASGGELTGKDLKKLETAFKTEIDAIKGVDRPSDILKTAYDDAYKAIKAFTLRNDADGSIAKANTGWMKQARFMEGVASNPNAVQGAQGTFSPSQMAKIAFKQGNEWEAAKGEAPLQAFANQALDVVGDTNKEFQKFRNIMIAGKLTGLGALGWMSPAIAIPLLVTTGTPYAVAKGLMQEPSKLRLAVQKAVVENPGLFGQAAVNMAGQLTNEPEKGLMTAPVESKKPQPQQEPKQSFNWTGGKLSATYPAVASLKVGSAGQFNPEHPIAQKVMQEAERQGLGDFKELLVRQAFQESKFNPNAKSSANARGVMQIVPGTARDLRLKDPYNPDENIRAGVEYMGQLLKRYDYDVKKALAAYNGGMRRIDKTGLTTLKPETRTYLKNILGE